MASTRSVYLLTSISKISSSFHVKLIAIVSWRFIIIQVDMRGPLWKWIRGKTHCLEKLTGFSMYTYVITDCARPAHRAQIVRQRCDSAKTTLVTCKFGGVNLEPTASIWQFSFVLCSSSVVLQQQLLWQCDVRFDGRTGKWRLIIANVLSQQTNTLIYLLGTRCRNFPLRHLDETITSPLSQLSIARTMKKNWSPVNVHVFMSN